MSEISELRLSIAAMANTISDLHNRIGRLEAGLQHGDIKVDSDYIVKNLRSHNTSDVFNGIIQNSPKESLSGIDVDISSYFCSRGEIFDAFIAAGYNINLLKGLPREIESIIQRGILFPHLHYWDTLIPRISFVARDFPNSGINWPETLKLIDREILKCSNIVDESASSESWKQEIAKMRECILETIQKSKDVSQHQPTVRH